MALKKGILDNYLKEREVSNKKPLSSQISSKYSHNRVFDEPQSLKQVLEEKKHADARNYINETESNSDTDASLGFKRFQTVSNGFKSPTQSQQLPDTSTIQNDTSAATVSHLESPMFHEEHWGSSSSFIENKDHKNDHNLNGSNRLQTASNQTASIGSNRLQTASDTVSKRPSLSEIKLLYYFQEIRDENGVIFVQRNQVAKALNLKLAGVKTALTRLKSKGYINLGSCSRGRYTGYTSYILTPIAYQLLSMPETLDLLGFKRFQTVSDTVSIPSISSSNKINTTTALPEEWKKINFDLLEPIGFSETQLCQLCDSGMTTPEVVQDAINRFAYSLEHNSKVKAYNDPLNVLMGVLRKGQRWIETNYVSPKELALRQILEEKRKQKEQYDAMVKEMMEMEFPEWRKKLTEEEIKNIVPPEVLKMKISAPVQAALRTYFLENILLPKLDA